MFPNLWTPVYGHGSVRVLWFLTGKTPSLWGTWVFPRDNNEVNNRGFSVLSIAWATSAGGIKLAGTLRAERSKSNVWERLWCIANAVPVVWAILIHGGCIPAVLYPHVNLRVPEYILQDAETSGLIPFLVQQGGVSGSLIFSLEAADSFRQMCKHSYWAYLSAYRLNQCIMAFEIIAWSCVMETFCVYPGRLVLLPVMPIQEIFRLGDQRSTWVCRS